MWPQPINSLYKMGLQCTTSNSGGHVDYMK